MRGSARLFVAAYPPQGVAQAMLDLLGAVPLPTHRATSPDQVHLTLLFLGDTSEREVPGVVQSVRGACAGVPSFSIALTMLTTVPKGHRARAVVAETTAPAGMLEIHRRLVSRLARSTIRRDNFRPHFTLARFAPPGAPAVGVERSLTVGPIEIDRIALVRSILRPEGAQHIPVEEFELS